jgi:hypothetical protein
MYYFSLPAAWVIVQTSMAMPGETKNSAEELNVGIVRRLIAIRS